MTNRTAASRYARALFDVAIAEKATLEARESELASFVDLFRENPAVAQVLLNPAVPAPRKRAALAEVTRRAKLSTVVGKLLVLLAERDRLILLPDLLAAYRSTLLDPRKVIRAEITTASPLGAERLTAIERSLSSATGRTVTVSARVDPSLIGGLVARVGSTVYDASVTHQLAKMKERLHGG